jgi:predicted oxidoreductase
MYHHYILKMATELPAHLATNVKGQFKLFRAKAVIIATGGIEGAYKITNSWEYKEMHSWPIMQALILLIWNLFSFILRG